MQKPILAGILGFSILALSILACAKATPEQIRKFTATPSSTSVIIKPTGTQKPILTVTKKSILVEGPTATPDRFYEISILAESLNVRDVPDGELVGIILKKGETTKAKCVDTWCELESGGFVWRGCVSDNPAKLGCEQR